MKAKVFEQGNGFPPPGVYVRGDDGGLYQVVSIETEIETGRYGSPSYVLATVEPSEWPEVPDEIEFPALVVLIAASSPR